MATMRPTTRAGEENAPRAAKGVVKPDAAADNGKRK
jgi:hypothetical protein